MFLDEHFGFLVDIAQLNTGFEILGDDSGEGFDLFVDVFLVVGGVDEESTGNVGVVAAIYGAKAEDDAVASEVGVVGFSKQSVFVLAATLYRGDGSIINVLLIEVVLF